MVLIGRPEARRSAPIMSTRKTGMALFTIRRLLHLVRVRHLSLSLKRGGRRCTKYPKKHLNARRGLRPQSTSPDALGPPARAGRRRAFTRLGVGSKLARRRAARLPPGRRPGAWAGREVGSQP